MEATMKEEVTTAAEGEALSADPGPKRRYRRRRPQAFVKLEPAPPMESVKPIRQTAVAVMPDARWLGEFVAALLAASP
jgi:hypothetical protein